jgi:hypothetical protein
MARLRVKAERSHLNLQDTNLIDITNFNTEFNIPIVKQIDEGPWETVETVIFTPEQTPGPTPEPQPIPGNVIWDSNVEGKWNDGNARTVDDKEGDVGPNGKGLYTAASGNPKLEIKGNGEADLVCEPGHGRIYICATNFNAALELEFNIQSEAVDNLSLKLRSRHQEKEAGGGKGPDTFGGFGNAISLDDVDFKTESWHNKHENSISKGLKKKLEAGKWYKTCYTCKNSEDNKTVEFKSEIDYGQGYETVLTGKHNSPKPFMMDKAKFDQQSYFWIRMNNEANGTVSLRNVRLIAL